MDMKRAINQVVAHRDLSDDEMTDVMHSIMTGGATPAQIGGFLVGLRMKGETVGEIAAAAVDVLPEEPPVDGDPLLDYAGDNLIVTPHIAWATDEARQNAIDELAANTRAFLGGVERNRVV